MTDGSTPADPDRIRPCTGGRCDGHCGARRVPAPVDDVLRALALLERGAVRVDEMITERYALRDAPRAFARAAQRGALKVLLYP